MLTTFTRFSLRCPCTGSRPADAVCPISGMRGRESVVGETVVAPTAGGKKSKIVTKVTSASRARPSYLPMAY